MVQLSDILERAVWLFGDCPGVQQGDVSLSYAELGRRVFQLAGAMQALGLQSGDRVAVLARNSHRNLEVHLACAHADLVLVPINIRLAGNEIDRILRITRTRLLFQALDYEASGVLTIRWDDAESPSTDNEYERLIERSPRIPAQKRGATETAEIYFTSGTTGEPKGACLTEQNLVASALDAIMTLELTAQSVWFHAPPMFHLVDAFSIWALTLVGGCHVTEHFDPATFCSTVESKSVTVVSLPPTLLDMIVRTPDFGSYNLDTLDRISFGGAPMAEPIYRRCAAAFGCPLVQSYGATETSGTVCQQMPYDLTEGPWRNSVGQPLPHIKIKVVDDSGEALAPGEIGELAVGGPRVMAGYWENPAATVAAFRDGFYLTGDLGLCDEHGHFTILGRKKDMIISGGENVYPAEVEKALLSHPDVVEAAVFGVPHAFWGEEVRAVVVLSNNSTVSPWDLIAHCRTLIGGYKVPKAVDLSADPLPKTGPGKIAKAIIRAKYLEAPSHAAT